MDETDYLLNSPANAERLENSIKQLDKMNVQRLDVIEQDGEKFVVLPDEVLEQCGVEDVVGISVEKGCIMLRAADKGMTLTNICLDKK